MFKENCLPIFRVLVITIIEVLGNKAMQVTFLKLLNSEKKRLIISFNMLYIHITIHIEMFAESHKT